MTIAMLCDNEKCRYHVPFKTTTGREPVIRTVENGILHEVCRYLYKQPNGLDFFLCEACHEAVKLVMKGRT